MTLAEAFVTATLRRWRLAELVDTARRVAAALVRRAVVTTGRPGPLPHHIDTATLRGLGEIKLWVQWEHPNDYGWPCGTRTHTDPETGIQTTT